MNRKQNKFARFGSWLRVLSVSGFVSMIIGITFLGIIFIMGPVEMGWISDIEFYPKPLDMDENLYALAFAAIIVAPLLETLLFQMLPFVILHRFRTFRVHRWAMVMLPALVFGSLHYYSVMYIIATVFVGVVLMYAYVVRWKRHAYWNVVLIHALWNALAFTIDQLEKQGYISWG